MSGDRGDQPNHVADLVRGAGEVGHLLVGFAGVIDGLSHCARNMGYLAADFGDAGRHLLGGDGDGVEVAGGGLNALHGVGRAVPSTSCRLGHFRRRQVHLAGRLPEACHDARHGGAKILGMAGHCGCFAFAGGTGCDSRGLELAVLPQLFQEHPGGGRNGADFVTTGWRQHDIIDPSRDHVPQGAGQLPQRPRNRALQ